MWAWRVNPGPVQEHLRVLLAAEQEFQRWCDGKEEEGPVSGGVTEEPLEIG